MPLRASDDAERLPPGNSSGSNGVPSADDSLPPSGPTLQQAFEALVTTFNERGIRYAIIGGIAMIQHTRVRATDDIDALLSVPQIALPGLLEALCARGFSIDIATTIGELRDHGLSSVRFQAVIVDLMRPVLPVYAHVLDRAIVAEILGQKVRVSSAEGLIVMKLIAMRSQDEADIQDLLAAYGGKLDFDFVRAELDALVQPEDRRRAKLEEWIRQTK
jgi:predicted nucleotidyltransferase